MAVYNSFSAPKARKKKIYEKKITMNTINRPELSAPAGTWEALVAAVTAGADAVYVGGKNFNMRMHDDDFNFDDATLPKAVAFAHEKNVRLYVTVNNLISEKELPELKKYLSFLRDEAKPDALIVQDLAVLDLARELNLNIPIHASVMMNVNNEHTVTTLKEYGVTRVVASRELSIDEVALLHMRTGIETEYFVHGDICVAESGQCIHSGVLFGQSGNRGRCLKPCRWKYRLVDEETGRTVNRRDTGLYRLAMKDLCLYPHLPELITSGINSFKIEGRMRAPDFIARVVAAYRRAIDAYLTDPTAYQKDEGGWQALYQNRVRDFTADFAVGKPDQAAIGLSGEREPRFFSKAVKEAGLKDDVLQNASPLTKKFDSPTLLTVRVGDYTSAKGAIVSGADIVYVGGEAFLPQKPWTLDELAEIIKFAHEWGAKIIVATPRTTTHRECEELKIFLPKAELLGADGVLVGNLGALKITYDCTVLPAHADVSLNLFNSRAVNFLAPLGVTMAAASLEMSFSQFGAAIKNAALPVEVVVHGANTAMVCDRDFSWQIEDGAKINDEAHTAFKDTADEQHPMRRDQYGRTHILFAKDLCLYPYMQKFVGAAAVRIEARDYSPRLTAIVVKAYRDLLDKGVMDKERFSAMVAESPRGLGVGVYRFR